MKKPTFNFGKFTPFRLQAMAGELKQLGLLAPAVVALAVGLLVLDAQQLQSVMAAAGAAAKESQIKLVKTPLAKADYDKAVEALQVRAPDIKVTGTATNLVISAKDGSSAAFADWEQAINIVQGVLPGVRWSADSLCVGNCQGTAMEAKLSGVRVSAAKM